MSEKMRSEFEADVIRRFPVIGAELLKRGDPKIERDWQTWQTAYKAAIEDAAKVCDEYPQRDPAEDGNGYWAAENCYNAIRQLLISPAN